jgi:molybdenum cofactor guanylyltransferase
VDAQTLPVVLAGGRSARFGRDKLREPWRGGILIDAPILALRIFFGGRVALVGSCHEDVAARADLVITDRMIGCGPMGGIVSSLEHPLGRRGVFVLAGDLPHISSDDVASIWRAAHENAEAWTVLADSGMLEPCIGLYRAAALPTLSARLAEGRLSLHDALPAERVVRVAIDAARVRNVNEAKDLG